MAVTDEDTGGSAEVRAGRNLSLAGKPLDIRGVLAKAQPAVVSIQTEAFVQTDQFFGRVQRVQGAGTGMVLSADGEVLTNNHVIDGAQEIRVTFDGEREPRPADLVGADPANDVAIIKIRDARGLPTVTLGSSDALRVGDDVVAIGNALALVGGLTVTRGIVSALDRSVGDTTERLDNLIQTDTAINSGNSGGPLVNAAGEVIGVNTIVIRGSESGAPVENIGFALAIDAVKAILPGLRTGAPTVGVAFVGVATLDLTSALSRELGVPVDKGAVVESVTPGSPADRAGLQRGDVIVRAGTKAISTSQQLITEVRASKPGSKPRPRDLPRRGAPHGHRHGRQSGRPQLIPRITACQLPNRSRSSSRPAVTSGSSTSARSCPTGRSSPTLATGGSSRSSASGRWPAWCCYRPTTRSSAATVSASCATPSARTCCSTGTSAIPRKRRSPGFA